MSNGFRYGAPFNGERPIPPNTEFVLYGCGAPYPSPTPEMPAEDSLAGELRKRIQKLENELARAKAALAALEGR